MAKAAGFKGTVMGRMLCLSTVEQRPTGSSAGKVNKVFEKFLRAAQPADVPAIAARDPAEEPFDLPVAGKAIVETRPMPARNEDCEMLKLKVPDMTCGHCAGVVTKALQSVDAAARIDIDLKSQTVSVETSADAAKLAQALDSAGYPAQSI
jgi:copper chaperone